MSNICKKKKGEGLSRERHDTGKWYTLKGFAMQGTVLTVQLQQRKGQAQPATEQQASDCSSCRKSALFTTYLLKPLLLLIRRAIRALQQMIFNVVRLVFCPAKCKLDKAQWQH